MTKLGKIVYADYEEKNQNANNRRLAYKVEALSFLAHVKFFLHA